MQGIRDQAWTWAEGAEISSSVNMQDMDLIGLWVPAVFWDDFKGVALRFKVAPRNTAPATADTDIAAIALCNPDGTRVEVTLLPRAVYSRVALDPYMFHSLGRIFLEVVDSNGAPVATSSARAVVYPIMRDLA